MKTRDKIIDYIRWYHDEHGYMPSIREIGDGVGLSSTSSVHRHFKKLFDDGILETDLDVTVRRAYRFAR